MSGRRTAITLVTEGGYPYSPGGVSVWCDQVVTAMPERDFRVVALTGARHSEPIYTMPSHVRSLTQVALWSPSAAKPAPRRRSRLRFQDVHRELLRTVLDPGADVAAFGAALHGMYDFAQGDDLGAALSDEAAVRALVDTWRSWPPGCDDPSSDPVEPTLGDAALVTTLLEHMLRPLTFPAVEGDLTHCASNGLAGLVALGARWTHETPIVVSEHGVYLRERYLASRSSPYGWTVKSAVLRLTRAITELVYAEADVIVPGNAYNRRWQVQGGADPGSIVTVYNGVDPAEFPESPPEPAEPTLVFVGRIDPIKDLENLVEAFALVVEQIPEARLRIFGVAPARGEAYLARCRQLVADLGLEESATFEGRAPSAKDAYSAGQVVVLSSISEGFPYTVIEAMSSGRATASTDVGGVAEAVGEAGLIVPARNPRAMADACVTLLHDAELRNSLGTAARTRILEVFTLQRSMDALGTVYDQILSPPAMSTTSGGRSA